LSHVLAVDLGGTKTSIALIDDSGCIFEKQRLPATPAVESTVEQIVARYDELKGNSIAAIGIIVPGIYDPGTGNAWAPNLWGKDFYPFRKQIEQHLSVPIEIGSDRVASAVAEQWLGVARGLRHVVFVAVGTGIGVGIISDGRPVEGAHGIAGAAGWMLVAGPWKPEYLACGGWETEAAGPALARRAGKQTAEAAIEAARAGDVRVLEAVSQTADYLALGISALIAVLDPEIVVLGGGVMQASDLMLEQIRRNALAWTQPVAAKHVRIETTALGEDAGLLGAARLAWLKTGL
jgi:glucokinase